MTYRSLLRKMTYEDEFEYINLESWVECIRIRENYSKAQSEMSVELTLRFVVAGRVSVIIRKRDL